MLHWCGHVAIGVVGGTRGARLFQSAGVCDKCSVGLFLMRVWDVRSRTKNRPGSQRDADQEYLWSNGIEGHRVDEKVEEAHVQEHRGEEAIVSAKLGRCAINGGKLLSCNRQPRDCRCAQEFDVRMKKTEAKLTVREL